MPYAETPFTHGGSGAYREIANLLLSNGWTRVSAAVSYSGPVTNLDALSIVQSTNLDIRTDPQTGIGTSLDLPVSFLRPTRVQKETIVGGAVVDLIEGTDYFIDYHFGLIHAIGGGWASDSSERFLIEQGDYDLRNGWIVFSSPGLSTQETELFIGLQLQSTGPYSGVDVVGVQWTLFNDFTDTVTDYFDTDESVRNKASLDVKSFVHPVASGTIFASVNADRFLGSISVPEAHNAWAYCGALGRVRPVLEQPCVSYMVGNQSEKVGSLEDDSGPVGDVTSRGSTSDSAVNGSAWMYDAVPPAFAGDTGLTDADLSSHFWAKRAEGGADDIVPSEVEVTPGERYFELHPVACANGIEDLNLSPDVSFGYVYGIAEGLFSVIKFLSQHRTTVVHLGETYTILKVGRSITRFIAIKQA